jgi:cytochrome oxidase Cu insertion factor (SCO1/SenC/PrrC family)
MKPVTVLLAFGALLTACGAPEQRSSSTPTPERGDPAPDFSLSTASGDRLSLADLRGKPALFYFSMGPG